MTTFNTELGRYRYTVMPFGITVTGDVFQRKLDQHFGQIEQVIVIADDIMIVGNQSNHRDHDVALTNLLATARRSDICLIMINWHTRKLKSSFLERRTLRMDASQPKAKSLPLLRCHCLQARSRYSPLLV